MDCMVHCAQSKFRTLDHKVPPGVCFTDLKNLLSMSLIGTFEGSKQRDVQHHQSKVAVLQRIIRV